MRLFGFMVLVISAILGCKNIAGSQNGGYPKEETFREGGEWRPQLHSVPGPEQFDTLIV